MVQSYRAGKLVLDICRGTDKTHRLRQRQNPMPKLASGKTKMVANKKLLLHENRRQDIQMPGNFSTNPGTGDGDSVECDKKLIRTGVSMINVLTKLEVNPFSCLSAFARTLFGKSEARKRWGFNRAWPKVIQVWRAKGVLPPKLSHPVVCLKMRGNHLTNQRLGKRGYSMEHDQKS